MKTMYKVHTIMRTISKADVVHETKKQVVVVRTMPSGRKLELREMKDGSTHHYCETWEEAKDRLVGIIERKIRVATSMLKGAQRELEEAKAIQEDMI